MKIGILGYEVPHRKVLEIAFSLKENGHEVTIFGFPFKARKNNEEPIFRDRPVPIMSFDLAEYLKESGIAYIRCDGWDEKCQYTFNEASKDCNYIITCIAKIIPKNMTTNNIILNTHPGVLPYNRGVDAFKRAIINNWPIGITLHRIDEDIDAGTVIKTVNVPIFPGDNLEKVCDRAFNIEIRLLIESSQYITDVNMSKKKENSSGKSYKLYRNTINSEEEERINDHFKENIRNFIAHSKKKEKHEDEFK